MRRHGLRPTPALLAGIFVASFVPATTPAVDLDRLPARLSLPSSEQIASTRASSADDGPQRFIEKASARRAAAEGRERVPSAERLERVRGRLETFARARALGLDGRADLRHLSSPAAAEDLARLVATNGDALRIVWDDGTGTPRFVAGNDLAPSARGAEAADAAASFLASNRELLLLENPAAEMLVRDVQRDGAGRTAVHFDQVHRGVPIWARSIVIRLDREGRVIGLSGRYHPTPVLGTVPSLGAGEARSAALAALTRRDGVAGTVEESELVLFPRGSDLALAWRVRIGAGLAYRQDAFVDAETGSFLHAVSLVAHGDGPVVGQGIDLSGQARTLQLWNVAGTAFMIDTTKPMFDGGSGSLPNDPRGAVWVIDAGNGDGSELVHVTSLDVNDWSGFENAVTAGYFASFVYDYFDERHSRNSIDAAGMTMRLVVNFQNDFNNAFWNGQFMVFGNGDGNAFSDLAGALDVTAHEMSHGVIEHSANLVYEFQPGALNEHFADVFGAATEFFVLGAGGNWLLGEDVTTPSVAGDCLRNMMDPGAANVAFGGQQPAHMDQFQNLPASTDNGGVHINSGIPNRAFYLASTAPSMDVGRTERIWYRALTQYLTRSSEFVDFRLAIIQAATDLFGDGSTEALAVTSALDQVGIVGDQGSEGGGDLPDNTGTDFLAVIDAATDRIARTSFPFTPESVVDLSGAPIGLGGRPSSSDDGEWIAWVGADNNINLTAFDGSTGFAVTNDAVWWSVALSASGRHLAATSVFEDGTIFVFDLVEPASSLSYELTSQNSTDGEVPDNVVFADVMEFSVVGDFLLYDALNRGMLAGQTTEYWDVNLLRLDDGEVFRVFQPLPPTESIGDPTFAQNSDTKIALDYLTDAGNILVVGYDFETGDLGQITDNFSSLGRPTFSGDDSQVYFQFVNGGASVWRVTLDADGVTGIGDDSVYLTGAYWPVHFTNGQRPTPVLLEELSASWRENVSVRWRLGAGNPYAAFHVDRSAAVGDGFERRSATPISANETDAAGRYRFLDAPPEHSAPVIYRIVGASGDGTETELGRTRVEPLAAVTNARPVLLPVAPNPAREGARLRFVLPEPSRALPTRLGVYDVSGRLVALPLERAALEPGAHVIAWDGRDARGGRLPAGIYVLRLESGGDQVARKLVLAN